MTHVRCGKRRSHLRWIRVIPMHLALFQHILSRASAQPLAGESSRDSSGSVWLVVADAEACLSALSISLSVNIAWAIRDKVASRRLRNNFGIVIKQSREILTCAFKAAKRVIAGLFCEVILTIRLWREGLLNAFSCYIIKADVNGRSEAIWAERGANIIMIINYVENEIKFSNIKNPPAR